jgi:hypothetical protein
MTATDSTEGSAAVAGSTTQLLRDALAGGRRAAASWREAANGLDADLDVIEGAFVPTDDGRLEMQGPAQKVQKLTADKCWCSFKDQATLHDKLVGIEDMGIPYAAELIAQIIGDDDLGVGNEYLTEPNDFERFVAEHNWDDPVGMAQLAHAVTWAAAQAFEGRHTEDRIRGALTEVRSAV